MAEGVGLECKPVAHLWQPERWQQGLATKSAGPSGSVGGKAAPCSTVQCLNLLEHKGGQLSSEITPGKCSSCWVTSQHPLLPVCTRG